MTPAGGGGGHYLPYPPPFPSAFHLLEVTVISAQDLLPAGRSMRTYAEAWVHPDNRLRTRRDPVGHTEPTWNDKFVFRINDATLRSDTSAVTVDVYAARSRFLPGSDTLLGTARAVLSTLRPSTTTRFVALQVRRPASLRPQGILNISVALLDAYVRSMPIYADLAVSAALALRDPVDGGKGIATSNGGSKKREAQLSRRGTVAVAGRAGERERSALDSKLEKWRAELPPLQDRDDEKEEKGKRPDGGGRGRWMEKRLRNSGRLLCFSVAGEADAEGGGGPSSRG